MKNITFQYKVIVITGSSQGIGKAIAIEFIKNGAAVVINGRNRNKLLKTTEELKSLGGRVLAFCGDVSKPDQAQDLILKTIEHFGKLDILVNNAGISMKGNLADLASSVYKKVFDINVLGSVNMCKSALPFLRESIGSIVFISSVAGIRGIPGFSAYSSSKMALKAIAQSLRIEEADSGIHVGLMYVGFTQNEREKRTLDADGSLVIVDERKGFKVQSRRDVAQAVLNNIKTRTFITTLSSLGKLNQIMQKVAPNLVEKILIKNSRKIKQLI